MRTYTEHYGADADGNRGVDIVMLEFDNTPEEKEEIRELLIDFFKEYGDTNHKTVKLGFEVDGYDFEDVEVDISDYFTNKELMLIDMVLED